MYNKIFTKILDSSIWLETDATRLVWLTMIAAMDENGFCQFAAPGNVSNRARVSLEATIEAIRVLESPDANSADPANEGRRIERVPGGWIVLNSSKYRDLVTRAVVQQKTKERVARFRAKKRTVTHGNAQVTAGNDSVMQSEADTEAETDNKEVPEPLRSAWAEWKAYRTERRLPAYKPRGEAAQLSRMTELGTDRAAAAIRFSIAQNYQGIFEEKSHGNNRAASPAARSKFADAW